VDITRLRKPANRFASYPADRLDETSSDGVKTAGRARARSARLANIRTVKSVVSRIFTSWNQIDQWLRRVQGLRRAA